MKNIGKHSVQYVLISVLVALGGAALAQPVIHHSIKDAKAIRYFEEAIRAYDLGLVPEAMDQVERAIDKAPNFYEAFVLRAQLHADQKNSAAAIADLERAIAIGAPGSADVHFYLGDLLMREADYASAKTNFEALVAKGTRNTPLLERAALYIRSCNFAMAALKNPVPFDPKNLGSGVNSEFDEYYPCVTADDQTLLFTRLVRDQRVRGGKQEDFYVSQYNESAWGPATAVAEINTAFNEGAPTLSADGQLLVFTACELMGGEWGPYQGYGSCDLFYARKMGDQWGDAVNLQPLNSYDWESQPSFSADGRTLYFVRGKRTAEGVGRQDIYYSMLQVDGNWSKPERIPGLVNTPFEEESVLIHPDGESLYFSSNGHPGMGGLDIFVSRKQADGSWGEPINLGYPINTGADENSILVNASGELAYFASNRDGGLGGLDLYSFELPSHARPKSVSFVKGEVFDAVSLRRLEARFELIDLETGEVVAENYSNPVNGEFLVVLPPGKDYALNVARAGYLFYSANFSLKGVKAGDPYLLEVPLEKLKEGSRVVLNNVFFATDSYALEEASRAELNKLVELLANNAGVRVEIGGHTDSVGSDADNLRLSEQRAAAVVDYLVVKGIPAEHLSAKGYGETQPVASNDTDKGRALNRRTEMKIIQAR